MAFFRRSNKVPKTCHNLSIGCADSDRCYSSLG
jgi:hypothetical protein